MGITTSTMFRNQMADAIQDIMDVDTSAVIFDEIEHEISLKLEAEFQAERNIIYGEEFGSWG